MADMEIRNLHVAIEGREILKGVNLTISEGCVHALMGPNGTGKSTLAYALMGHPSYAVTEGEVWFKGQNILELAARPAFTPGNISGIPISGGDPWRYCGEFPQDGAEC